MSLPLALLAGFGAGASTLGGDLATRELMRQQKQRQDAQDALTRLLDYQKIGATEVPQGQDPNAFLSSLTKQNNMSSGLNPGGTGPSAIPNSALGIPDESTPASFGQPRVAQIPGPDGQMRSVIINPAQSPEALQERRMALQQAAVTQRAQQAEAAKVQLQQQKDQAVAQARNATNQKAFGALKVAYPKNILGQTDYDQGIDYVGELAKEREQERQLALAKEQAALRTPPVEQYGDFTDTQGQRHYVPKQVAAQQGWLPTPSGGGGLSGGMGAGGIGGLARVAGAITEMGQADQMMRPYEEAVKAKQAKYDGLDYFQTEMAKMYDAHGIKDQAEHALAYSHLNSVNPDLANYLRAGEAWALADGALSGRTSDFRTKLDAFVSAIGPNAGTQHINNTQQMRGTRLQEIQKFQPAMEAMAARITGSGQTPAAGAQTAAPHQTAPTGNINLGEPKITPAERAALKQRGFTDAQITAKYGPP